MPVPFSIIEAPSVLGLSPSGVEHLPDALRASGLHERLRSGKAVRVEPPPYDDRRDPATGILNARALAEYTRRLADAVQRVLDGEGRPLVLGGDCSILLGNLLALARLGRHGLLFLDGHADFYQPSANVNGQAASSELAFATGRGPGILTRFDEHGPLVRDEQVVAFGIRDADEAARYGSEPLPASIRAYDLRTIRRVGISRAADDALDYLREQRIDGLWIHFDVDVLDDAIMPAVDYRLPGGLSWPEAEHILRVAHGTGLVAGVDVTIFNPRLDPDGSLARALVDLLVRSMGGT